MFSYPLLYHLTARVIDKLACLQTTSFERVASSQCYRFRRITATQQRISNRKERDLLLL